MVVKKQILLLLSWIFVHDSWYHMLSTPYFWILVWSPTFLPQTHLLVAAQKSIRAQYVGDGKCKATGPVATWHLGPPGWLQTLAGWIRCGKKYNGVFHGARAFALNWKCSKSLLVPLPSPRNPLRKRVTRSAATSIALRTSCWAALGCSTAFVVMEPAVKRPCFGNC